MMRTSLDLAWAAGFIEGEGSFYHNGNSATVRAAQVQREPLERLQRLFGGAIGRYANGAGRWIHQWYVHGKRAAEVTMTLYVLLSPRRKGQAAVLLRAWRAKGVSARDRTTCMRGHDYVLRARKNGTVGRYCSTCQCARAKEFRVKKEQRP